MAPPRNGAANPGTSVHISPAASPPSPRDGSEEEAFFPDEAGATLTARKLHENRFIKSKTQRVPFYNPLLDAYILADGSEPPADEDESGHIPELTKKEAAKSSDMQATAASGYRVFVPAGAAPPFKISVLFGVGQELIRHGLRTFFESLSDRAFILVPGIEAGWPIAKEIGRAWGVGITTDIIEQLLSKAGFAGAAFTIDVLAGYSTGYRGLVATINNWESATLDLTSVRTVIFYDALYRGDEPAPGDNTKRALTYIGPLTGDQVRIIVYEVTAGGTPRDSGDTRVPQAWLASTFPGRYQLINLKPIGTGLFALIYARMFDAAVKDGYFAASELPTALQNLIAVLPPRGTVASTLPLLGLSLSTKVSLADWAKLAVDDVTAVQANLEDLRSQVISDSRYTLMGWYPKDVGEILHDGFIPEFAWEFLCG